MAESGDTYSNEGDSCAPEGMGDEPDLLERAQKVGHAPYTAAAACNFLCAPVPGLTCSISSRFTFWLVLHAWQMFVPMSKFFMLLWPTVVVQLWQLCTTLHRAAPGRDHKVPR